MSNQTCSTNNNELLTEVPLVDFVYQSCLVQKNSNLNQINQTDKLAKTDNNKQNNNNPNNSNNLLELYKKRTFYTGAIGSGNTNMFRKRALGYKRPCLN